MNLISIMILPLLLAVHGLALAELTEGMLPIIRAIMALRCRSGDRWLNRAMPVRNLTWASCMTMAMVSRRTIRRR